MVTNLPKPGAGWEPAREVARRLAILPGGMEVRERLAIAFVAPKWRWAVPLLEPVPGDVADELRKAILRSACTWWCRGRWWADRVLLHPRLGGAVFACQAADRLGSAHSDLAEEVAKAHLRVLGLTLVASGVQHWWVKPAASVDARIGTAARRARVAQEEEEEEEEELEDTRPLGFGRDTTFLVDRGAGGHALRVIARIVALGAAAASRHDAESLGDVDVDVLCSKVWTKWKGGLTHEERRRLAVWRG